MQEKLATILQSNQFTAIANFLVDTHQFDTRQFDTHLHVKNTLDDKKRIVDSTVQSGSEKRWWCALTRDNSLRLGCGFQRSFIISS